MDSFKNTIDLEITTLDKEVCYLLSSMSLVQRVIVMCAVFLYTAVTGALCSVYGFGPFVVLSAAFLGAVIFCGGSVLFAWFALQCSLRLDILELRRSLLVAEEKRRQIDAAWDEHMKAVNEKMQAQVDEALRLFREEQQEALKALFEKASQGEV